MIKLELNSSNSLIELFLGFFAIVWTISRLIQSNERVSTVVQDGGGSSIETRFSFIQMKYRNHFDILSLFVRLEPR